MPAMESPSTSLSSSSASLTSTIPTSRSASLPSSASSNSIDSSLDIPESIQEDEAGLAPLLPDEEQEHQGMMSGRSPSNRSRAPPRRPAQAAVLPRRNSVTKMVNHVQDFFAKGPIIGKTRDTELVEQTEELTFGYSGADKFDLVEALPEGIEGQCFVKKAASTGNLFVVKHTKAVGLRGPEDREFRDSKKHKFPNEARMLGFTLKAHRNTVQLLQVVEDKNEPGRYFLWMEYCSGGDLFGQIQHWWYKKRSPVPEQFLLHTFVSLVDALAFLHHGLRSRGDGRYTEDEFHDPVIHSDLKCENIFLRWSGKVLGGMPEVVLGDFGIAKRADKKGAKINPGTAAYLAPEDIAISKGCPMTAEHEEIWLKVVDERTTAMDMYSLGQIMYQMASREPEPREIGLGPSDLRISREYDTPGLREAIVKCLTVNKDSRAQASFHGTLGILPDVNRFRTARDALVQRRMVLDRMEWARPMK